MKIDIEAAIPRGKENAVHMAAISECLGIDARTVRMLIRKARQNGVAIMSDASGYWITDDKSEIERYLLHVKRDAKARFITVKAIRKRYNEISGQMTLEETENGQK